MGKEKIFVSAYACEPNKGSEIGVGWHWILEMSKQFDLWVLTRTSNKNNIQEWVEKNPQYKDIHFVYYDLPKCLSWWKKGLQGVRTYYVLWQKSTNKIVKQIMTRENIELYHLLTYGNVLWPASRYGMKQFFIWGPTGGTDTIPYEFMKYYGVRAKIIELVRYIIVKTLPLNYGFQKRVKNANIILCKSDFMYENIPRKYRNKAIVFTDVAVDKKVEQDYLFDSKNIFNDEVRYFAAGKFDAWRGFDLLIEAFKKACEKKYNLKLEIAGTGYDKKRIQKIILKNDLMSKVSMLGKITEEEFAKKMRESDVIVNPVLKEGGVTVAFESMAMGKPLICVETGGYTRYFKKEFAVVLEWDSRKELVNNLAEAIIKTSDGAVQKTMGAKAKEISKKFTWEEKGRAINNIIKSGYKEFQER